MPAGLFLALATELSLAALFYPALALTHSKRAAILAVLCACIMLAPLLVGPQDRPMRLLAAVWAEILCVKLYDIHVGAVFGVRPNPDTFFLFLLQWFSLVLRKRSRRSDVRRAPLVATVKAAMSFVAGGAVLLAIFQIDWCGQPFILEHIAKTMGFFLALFSYGTMVAALQRLSGGTVQYPEGTPFLARTPADFWRRYNPVVQQFCNEDLFKRLGRRFSPVRATLITFLLSGLFHEYVFGISIGRIQGYQFLFFTLQGCAAAATLTIKPRSHAAIAWMAGTLVFNVAAAIIFFASVNGIAPFYSRGLPGWLAGW
jgi:MBOAT, membrane-bound O-acyltransferase family